MKRATEGVAALDRPSRRLRFSKHNGHRRAHGLVSGVIHKKNGTTRTFSVMRTLRVKSMNGTVPGAARTAADAKALPGPAPGAGTAEPEPAGAEGPPRQGLLNIVAHSGAGQLLGNLVCAVAHLLDSGGTLSQLLTKLGKILDQLLMGL